MKYIYSIGFLILSFHAIGQCNCDAIQATGTQITVSNITELEFAIDQANANNGNTTIILLPGVYPLISNLRFISENMANTTIMGSTQNSDDVYIRGMGWDNNSVTHIFNVAADNFTVANMTIGEVFYHPVQVQSNPADADNFIAQNVKFVDSKEQLLKVSAGGDLFAENGIIQCCEFIFTEGIAYQFYTGGIDAHRAKDWEVKYNTFRGIRSPETNLAEHAIHFWRESSGTIVDANLIIDCDRGIGFGLGQGLENGHTGGLIMNNMVHTSRDVGIGLESSTDTKIYNNTVVTENYPRSIEYRFTSTTDALIANNLVNGEISDRSSGSTGVLTTNYQFESSSIFEEPSNYNFHLDELNIDFLNIVGVGTKLDEVDQDYDCHLRTLDNASDIGADQILIMASKNDQWIESSIKVYPNPNVGTFTLEGNLDGASIKIYDDLGRLILSEKSISKKIQIENLDAGVYYIYATKEGNFITKKIVVLE